MAALTVHEEVADIEAEQQSSMLSQMQGTSIQVVAKSWSLRRISLVSLVFAVVCALAVVGLWRDSGRGRPATEEDPRALDDISIPKSIIDQCWRAWGSCSGAENFESTSGPCKSNLQAILSYSPGAFGGSTQTFFDRLKIDEGCDLVHFRCSASFGSYIGAGTCCGQADTVTQEVQICPMNAPVCTGYVKGVSYGSCQHVSADTPWPTGETLGCSNTPLWTNGYAQCSVQEPTRDLCQPGGWTCAGYLKNQFCDAGTPAPWSSTPAGGPSMNYPEKNCCGCGGGRLANTVAK